MKLDGVLTAIGLTTREAKIYLSALELGPSPASKIAQKAKLNRVSTYDILEKLIKKGFISTYIKSNVKYFAATDPDIIKSDYQSRLASFKEVLPDLRRLHGKTSHAQVRYFEGLDGIKMVYEDTLTSKTELLNYADSKSIRDHWATYDEDYVRKRVKKKIYLRGIAPKDEYGENVIQENKKNHREIRLVIPTEFSFANEIFIYDDKIAIISYGKDELVGMIIESPEIASTQRAIFMMAWAFAGGKKGK